MATGQFPIDYSQSAPSGRPSAAPITADVGAPYRALADLGSAVFAIGADLQDSRDRMEMSSLKRKAEEINNAAYLQMSKENDPEKRKAVWEQSKQDQSALRSERNSVQQNFQIWLNDVQPTWDRYTQDLNQTMVKREVIAEFKLNAQHALETNDFDAYKRLLNDGLETGWMTKAEYDYYLKNMGTDATFAQARLILNDDPFMAVQILENMPDLTGEQLDRKDELVRTANQRAKMLKTDSNNEYWNLLQSGQFEELEAQLNNPANPLPAEGEGGKNWWYNLLQKRREDLAQTDLNEQAKISEAILFNPETMDPQAIRNRAGLGVHGGLSINKINEYQEKFKIMSDPKGPLRSPVARNYLNKLMQAKSSRSFSVNPKVNEQHYGQSLDAMSDYFIDFREKNGRDPTADEADKQLQQIMAGYRGADAPFTDAHIFQTEGSLEAGGYRDIYNMRVRFRNADEAIEYTLTRLGPDWAKISPRSAEIIRRKYIKKVKEKTAGERLASTRVPAARFQESQQVVHTNGATYEYRNGEMIKISEPD